MNYEEGKKYFTQKSNCVPITISVILIIVGFLIFLFLPLLYVTIPLEIVALIIIAIEDSRYVRDGDIDQIMNEEFEKFKRSFREKYILSAYLHNQLLDKSICDENVVYNFTYDFECNGILINKGIDGKYRSSRCHYNAVLFTEKYLIIQIVTYSFIEKDIKINDYKYGYHNLYPVELIEFEEGTISANKYKILNIRPLDNSVDIRLIIPNNPNNQSYIDRINRKINK